MAETVVVIESGEEIVVHSGSLSLSTVGALNDLSDVTITTPSDGEVPRYNGSAWVNAQLAFADLSGTAANAQVPESAVTQHQAALAITESQISDLGAYLTDITGESLADLSDVAQVAPTANHVLARNASNTSWESRLLAAADIPTLDAAKVGTGTFADGRIAQSNVTQHQAALSIAETQIPDGSLLGRVGDAETVTGLWSFAHASGLLADVIGERSAGVGVTVDGVLLKDGAVATGAVPEAAVTQHEAALTILESQISDGAVLARVGAAETITGLYTFSHASGLLTNTIGERTTGSGVTIDGLLVKDAGIPEAAVTAHEAALSIAVGQLTGTLAVTSGGTGLATVAAGDVLYGSAANTLAALTKGNDGQVLTLASGLPSWANVPGGSFGDDEALNFGAGTDYWFIYDSTATRFELNSTNVDGAGADGVVFSVADGTDDVAFSGAVTATGLVTANGGITSPGSGSQTELFGSVGATTGGDNCVLVGYGATLKAATHDNSVVIGQGAESRDNDVVIGQGADAGEGLGHSVIIGTGTMVAYDTGSNIGSQVAIGSGARTGSSTGDIAIGRSSTATGGIAIGYNATATSGRFVVSHGGQDITGVYLGGVTDAAPHAVTYNGVGGSGTNIAGADLSIAGGKGTGSGVGGWVRVQTAPAGGSGTTPGTLADRFIVTDDGYCIASAPNAAPTDGDLFASSRAFYVDESGNNLMVRVLYADGNTYKTGTVAALI